MALPFGGAFFIGAVACFCGERTDVPLTEAAVADTFFATGGGHGDHGTIGGQFDHGVWVGRTGLGELVR